MLVKSDRQFAKMKVRPDMNGNNPSIFCRGKQDPHRGIEKDALI